MGLSELILQYESEDPEELALAILQDVLNSEDLILEIVVPALRSAIITALRNMAREAEEHSYLSNKPTADPTADRMAFLAEKFYVPGVGFVSWAEATVDHHQMRIDYLNRKVNGLIDTITRHDKAIQEIRKAKVKNLGELHAKPKQTRRRAS